MALTEYANIPVGIVTAGGTTHPAAGTVENWTVTAATAFPVASSSATLPTQFHICDPAANSEQILVTVAPGGTGSGQSWTVTRGAEGTTPVAHTAGFTIYQVVTSGDLAQIARVDWLNAVTMFGADPTGTNDSTTAIQAAINSLVGTNGVVYLPAGTYKISSALTLHTQIALQGDGVGQSFSLGASGGPTIIKQTSTTAHGIYQNDATQTGIRDLMLLGPSSGSGDGIHLTWTSNTNVYQVDLRNVMVSSFGGHGVYANTLLGTHARMVISTFNGGDGFHLVNTCTSCVWDSCAAPLNTGYGWYVNSCNYLTFNGCAADGNANGWYLTGCQSITINGSGTENNTTDGLILDGGGPYVVNGFWVSNNHYGIHCTSASTKATLIGVFEVNLGSAVWSILADSGSTVVLIENSLQTASSIPDTFGFGFAINLQDGHLTANYLTQNYGLYNGTNSITQGSGAPSSPTLNNPVAGDIYFRTDTPATSGQQVYICTTGGASPVWAAVSGGSFLPLAGGTMTGLASFNGGTDTSGTAAASSPTFVSGTAQQPNTTQDIMLYISVNVASSALTIAIGPTSGVANQLCSITSGEQVVSIRVPKAWWVKITATIANLTITAVTC